MRPGLSTCCPRAIDSAPGRDIPDHHAAGRDGSPVADRDRRHQRRIRADEHAFADYRAGFVNAVVIAGDRAGADIGARADLAVADIGEVIGLGSAPSRAALTSTKLPTCTWSSRTAPGRRRANGPTRAPAPTAAPSRYENEQIRAPSPTVTPAPKVTLGSTTASRPRRVSAPKHGLRRHQGRPRVHCRAAQPALHQRLGLGQLGARVDPDELLRRQLDRSAGEPFWRAMATISVR